MGVVDIHGKLRVALGTVKDHVSIGKAIIYNNLHQELGKTFSDIEIAVLRATGHDNGPFDDKHMHQILFLVSNAPSTAASIAFLAEHISRRLSKTRDPLVALKTLFLIHRLLRGGNRCFEQQLRRARISGHLQLQISFSHHLPCSFLHKYAAYLEERIGWAINQAGKLEPANYYANNKYCIDMVFRKLPKCQVFIDKVLDCWAIYADDNTNVWSSPSQVAAMTMSNTLKESFQVYMTYCEGVAALVNMFFDLSMPARALACRILKTAAQQTQQLHQVYENCRRVLDSKNLEYPTVEILTMDHVRALENYSNYQLPITKFTGKEGDEKEATITSSPSQLETKVSKVWVMFEDEDHLINY
ncbi:hypothetical protein JCGZ_13399 [Jatropha curcas]|uniref:ENTH domain-containing protein n=1 Tax=Jatropha curcas TaxID=180498 RepID=A0A067KKY0_JATCU|nr:putative clathrin assembly protein At1g33340 [Jatropha curcas]KDP32474.1 hypothetical protein JCGZ_13399 [Jatropha curcas]